MALEASDLNDGTILQATKQTTDARGNIQFSVELPSGRLLKSDFISPDNARKAIFGWIEAVKANAVADSKAEAEERRAKSKRQAVDLERRPGDDQPLFRAGGGRGKEPERVPDYVDRSIDDASVEEWTHASSQERVKPPIRPNETIQATDPLEYARQQYNYYAALLHDLKPKVAQYEKFVQQWGVILESLEPEDDTFGLN